METAIYALLGLSAILSLWQFALQPSQVPLDGPTPAPLAPHLSHHQAASVSNRRLEGKLAGSRL